MASKFLKAVGINIGQGSLRNKKQKVVPRRQSREETRDRKTLRLRQQSEPIKPKVLGVNDYQVEPRSNGRDNIIGIVLPARCGKTTFANTLGWLDTDSFITDDQRARLSAGFCTRYLDGGWDGAMEQYNTLVDLAMSRLYFSDRIVMFGHSVGNLHAIGVTARFAITPTPRFVDELLSSAPDSDKAFAGANYRAVLGSSDGTPTIPVDSYEDINNIIEYLSKDFGMFTNNTASEASAVYDMYMAGSIVRGEADRLVASLGRPYRGLGRSAGSWARVAAKSISTPIISHGVKAVIDPEVMRRANAVDGELVEMIMSRKMFDPIPHLTACMCIIIATADMPDLRRVIGSMLTTPYAQWGSMMRAVGSLVCVYNNYLGYELSEPERRVVSELWLLGFATLNNLGALISERIGGHGWVYKPKPTANDVYAAMRRYELCGGKKIRDKLLSEIKSWLVDVIPADSVGSGGIGDISEAFTLDRGTSWYDACKVVYHNSSSEVLGRWLVGLVKVEDELIGDVIWSDRVEMMFSKLLCYLVASYQANISLKRYSSPIAVGDAVGLQVSMMSLGFSARDIEGAGMKCEGLYEVSEAVSYCESRVMIANEVTVMVVKQMYNPDLCANLFQRANRVGAIGVGWLLRRRYGPKHVTDGRIKRHIERACSPISDGGRGLMTIDGRVVINGKWVVKDSLKVIGAAIRTYGKCSFDIDSGLQSEKIISLGLMGSMVTQNVKSAATIVCRLVSKREIVAAETAVIDPISMWEIDDLFSATATVFGANY